MLRKININVSCITTYAMVVLLGLFSIPLKGQTVQSSAAVQLSDQAESLLASGQGDAALTAANAAIAIDSNLPGPYFIKGQVLVSRSTFNGKGIVTPPGCVDAYKKFLELAPNDPKAPIVKEILESLGVIKVKKSAGLSTAEIFSAVSGGLAQMTDQLAAQNAQQSASNQALNQQLANINAINARNQSYQQAQAQAATRREQASSATSRNVSPVLGQLQNKPASSTTIVGSYSSQPASTAVIADNYQHLNTLCPANGLVPGLTRQAAGTSSSVTCTPGAVIYVDGIPKFDVCGTNYIGRMLVGAKVGPCNDSRSSGGGSYGSESNGISSNGSGANGNGTQSGGSSGQTSGGGSGDGPSENACIQLSRNAQDYPVFHNTCSFTIHYFWTPVNPRHGEFEEQNSFIAPGETQQGYEGNSERIEVYACQSNYLVRDADGYPIYSPVTSFRCIPPM